MSPKLLDFDSAVQLVRNAELAELILCFFFWSFLQPFVDVGLSFSGFLSAAKFAVADSCPRAVSGAGLVDHAQFRRRGLCAN